MSDADNRDPRLDAAYRATPREVPPGELDERIRAAARRAVAAGPQSGEAAARAGVQRSWVSRWRVPVSLAATVVIVVTLTVMMQDEESRRAKLDVNGAPPAAEAPGRAAPAAEAARIDERTAPPSAPPFRPELPATGESRTPAEVEAPSPAPQAAGKLEGPAARGALSKELENRQADSASTVPPAAPAVPAAPPPAVLGQATPSQATIQAAPASPPPSDAVAPSPAPFPAPAAPAPALRAVPSREAAEALSRDRSIADRPGRMERGAAPPAFEAKVRTPEAWVEEIRRLRAQGRDAEAAAELAELRKRHPDFVLPPDLAK